MNVNRDPEYNRSFETTYTIGNGCKLENLKTESGTRSVLSCHGSGSFKTAARCKIQVRFSGCAG
jgi:hypothetical protein